MRNVGTTLALVAIAVTSASVLFAAERLDQLGDPLPAGAVQRLGTRRMRYRISDMVYSHDGSKALVVAGKELHVWDLARGERLGAYPVSGGKTSLRTLAVSPDGRVAVIGDSEGTVSEWDLQEHRVVSQFATGRKATSSRNGLVSARYSPDGRRILTLDYATSTVEEWDKATGKRRIAIEATESKFARCVYGPDGTTAFIGSQDQAHAHPRHEVYHHDLTTGKLLKALKKSTIVGVYDMDLSRDGERLLARLRYRATVEWRLSDYELLHQGFRAPGRPGPSAAYAGDERFLLTGSRDGTVRVWNRHTGEVVRKWAPHRGWVGKIRVSPDGKWALSYASGHLIVETSIDTGRPRLPWDRHLSSVQALAFAPDGSRIVSGSLDRTIRVWDVSTWKTVRTVPSSSGVTSVAVSPDGLRMLAGSKDGKVRELMLETGEPTHVLRGHLGHVRAVAYLRAGRALSTADDGVVRVWNIDKEAPVHVMTGHLGGVMDLAVSPDGKRALSGGRDCTVREWDLNTGRLLHTTLAHRGEVHAVAYSPDGRHAISGGREGLAIEWSLEDWRACQTFNHGAWVRDARYVSNGQYVCTAGTDSKVILWSRDTGNAVKTLSGHGGSVDAVASSPDNRWLLSAGADTTILVWELADLLPIPSRRR